MVHFTNVVVAKGFLDFALAEDGTQFGRDGLAEIVGVGFVGQLGRRRQSLRTTVYTLPLYPFLRHGG